MARYSKERGGWINPASRENGAQGGRPRTRITLHGPGAIYVWTVARQEHGPQATEEEAEAVLERMVAEYVQNHRTPQDEA